VRVSSISLATPARSPMGTYRALAAKCAADGFRESVAHFRADGPINLLPKSSRSKKTLAIRSGKSDGTTVNFAKLPDLFAPEGRQGA
jgi:hypothetical protein